MKIKISLRGVQELAVIAGRACKSGFEVMAVGQEKQAADIRIKARGACPNAGKSRRLSDENPVGALDCSRRKHRSFRYYPSSFFTAKPATREHMRMSPGRPAGRLAFDLDAPSSREAEWRFCAVGNPAWMPG
jgi:hypothetical protein